MVLIDLFYLSMRLLYTNTFRYFHICVVQVLIFILDNPVIACPLSTNSSTVIPSADFKYCLEIIGVVSFLI